MKEEKSIIISTGLAMFSMFFGAGNVVFPLALGHYAQDQNFYSILGLMISGICVPFTGLIAMILFNGKYQEFFARLGKIPGFLAALAIMLLLGPFGAIPRCIALSYSTVTMFTPPIPLALFSAASCVILFLFTFRPSKIIDVLGKYLTPFLLGSLIVIIVKGIFSGNGAPLSTLTPGHLFMEGLIEGYQTMDLIGAFFFSSMVAYSLTQHLQLSEKGNSKKVVKLALKASAIGAFLLAAIYVGFSYTAAINSDLLVDVPKDKILGSIALQIMGPYAGIVASTAVALACLTTAIALVNIFAEFIHKDISEKRISYQASLIITLIVTFFISILEFNGIAAFLVPVLTIAYPALIALSVLNILYKLYNVKPVKGPVLAVFLLTIAFYALMNL